MNKKINNNIINKMVDTFDMAVKLYYNSVVDSKTDNTAITNYNIEKGRPNYISCLLQVVDVFLGIDQWKFEDQNTNKIDQLFAYLHDDIEQIGINCEEVRQAFLLLNINGYKNVLFSPDLITPDSIGLICSMIINDVFKESDHINILDPNAGSGNLVFTIVNQLDKNININLLDNHPLMCDIATMVANMMNQKINVFFQDALEYLIDGVNLIVSDLASYEYVNPYYNSHLYEQGVRYFPYLLIEHFLSLKNDCLSLYIIDHDFFSQPGNDLFHKIISQKGSIKALVVLPNTLFIDPNKTKSLLIINNRPNPNHKSSVYLLPSPNDNDNFIKILTQIIDQIREPKSL